MILDILLVLLETCSKNIIKGNESFQKAYSGNDFVYFNSSRDVQHTANVCWHTPLVQQSKICSPLTLKCGGLVDLQDREREREDSVSQISLVRGTHL